MDFTDILWKIVLCSVGIKHEIGWPIYMPRFISLNACACYLWYLLKCMSLFVISAEMRLHCHTNSFDICQMTIVKKPFWAIYEVILVLLFIFDLFLFSYFFIFDFYKKFFKIFQILYKLLNNENNENNKNKKN